jgi:thioredoxin-related protein
MKESIFALFLLLSGLAVAASAESPQALPDIPSKGQAYTLPDWFKVSFLNIGEDATEAAAQHKHLLLFLHLENCPYCAKMLKENFTHGANTVYMQQHFDVVAIDVQGTRDVQLDKQTHLYESEFATRLGVQFTPTIVFVDGQGKPVLQLSGYKTPKEFARALHYVKDKAYSHMTFPAYLKKIK